MLLNNAGKVLTQRQLLNQVWGPTWSNTVTICVFIWDICDKNWNRIPARPRHFITETGIGYRFML
ncbi:winged helix-turn-helix domain-containing protein [Escherichia coli]